MSTATTRRPVEKDGSSTTANHPGADPDTARRTARGRVAVLHALRYAALLLVLGVMVGPFLWQLSTSLKGLRDQVFGYPPQLLPHEPTLSHYAAVTETVPVLRYATNSLVVAVSCAATNIVFGSMAGYAMARMTFRGRKIVFACFLATIIIPFESILVSEFLIVRSLGINDTLLGVMVPLAVTGLSVLLMRNAFAGLPAEVEEAAVLDGAGEWQRFWRIAMPSVRGTMAVVGIFSFVFAWDDFLWPLVVLSDPGNYTLTVGIQYLSGTFTNDQRVIAAGTMMAVVPLMVLFFSLQRFFFRGVGEGAVKG
ncbi:carbohydrate ABC transporter permease [Streptomyces sp. NPDC058985]|uniref:carbohydrate ABC transporter permease n=1 Tax=Streptomyces sp. NPDC058985 TaxID=3346684 RepID=UPI0036A507AF